MRYLLVSTADNSKTPIEIPDEMIPDKINKKCKAPPKKNKLKSKKIQSSNPFISYKKVVNKAKKSKKGHHAHRGNK